MNKIETLTELTLNKRPSVKRWIFDALLNLKNKPDLENKKLPPLSVRWDNIKLSPKYLSIFRRVCEYPSSDTIPELYPFTLLYPVNLWLFNRRNMSIPVFKMLATRNETTLYREISEQEVVNLTSQVTGQTLVNNGFEFYTKTIIESRGEHLWENTATFFVRDTSINNQKTTSQPKLTPITNAAEIANWVLPARNRFEFAQVLGDSNGLHYSPGYSKLLGYQRDFAHPTRLLSQCLKYLPDEVSSFPLKMETHCKGPVYYNKRLSLRGAQTTGGYRFDLYCEGNIRPCISGNVK